MRIVIVPADENRSTSGGRGNAVPLRSFLRSAPSSHRASRGDVSQVHAGVAPTTPGVTTQGDASGGAESDQASGPMKGGGLGDGPGEHAVAFSRRVTVQTDTGRQLPAHSVRWTEQRCVPKQSGGRT